jgi:hypothetical protein
MATRIHRTSFLAIVVASVSSIACNAVFGLDELHLAERKDKDGEASADASQLFDADASFVNPSESSFTRYADGSDAQLVEGGNVCTPGSTRPCSDLGNCGRGHRTCTVDGVYASCDVSPKSSDSCEVPGDDANCNGIPNEGCSCIDGTTQPCGPENPKGICKRGTSTCKNEHWDLCTGVAQAKPRDCSSVDDNDCDGQADNVPDIVCKCIAGSTRPCGAHSGLDGNGICHAGHQTCVASADGSSADWSTCLDSVSPTARDCASTVDNDCDGKPDNTVDAVCKCVPGSKQSCQAHPGADGKGSCKAGEQTCAANVSRAGSDWGACTGAVAPAAADLCTTKGDDSNCNGQPNDGCPCVEGETQTCGPTNPQGICKAGVVRCQSQRWTACDATFPKARDCTSAVDNDCDGKPDNTVDTVCQCGVGTARACQTHPGLDGHGPCQAGSQTCAATVDKATSTWGGCSGSVGPGARDCTSTLDNDCNGVPDNTIDSTCRCHAGDTEQCGFHPGNDGKGPCKPGTHGCIVAPNRQTSTWDTACPGSVGPAASDTCDANNDNNCSGTFHDGCTCVNGQTQGCGTCGTTTCVVGQWSTNCTGQCIQPRPTCTNNMCVCQGTTCNNQCVDTTSDKQNCGMCGRACADRFDATASCSGSTCVFQCTSGHRLVCSTSTQPACASWSFESGLENWTVSPGASMSSSTSQAFTGTHSLAVIVTVQDSNNHLSAAAIYTQLCPPGAAAISLAGKDLHFRVMVQRDPNSPALLSASANPETFDGDGTIARYIPNLDQQLLPEGTWVAVDGHPGSTSFDNPNTTLGLVFGLTFADSPGFTGPWRATFYVDDVQIQ